MGDLFARASVRQYLDKPVEEDKINMILKAAMAAPSACNQQAWRFYVVTNKEKIKALAHVSHFSTFAEKAPVIIVTVFRRDCQLPEFAPQDLGAAMENMYLEAASLGLGGVWMGVMPRQERMKAVADIIGTGDAETVFSMFALGYPEKPPKQHHRYHEEWITYLR